MATGVLSRGSGEDPRLCLRRRLATASYLVFNKKMLDFVNSAL
jgi:hypothetical protein